MLETMEFPIQKLSKASNQCFSEELGTTSFEENLNTLASLMNNITCEDLNVKPTSLSDADAPIIYIPVCKHDNFSMSMFALSPQGRIPLHDHPQMYGLFKVIYGALHLKSYSRTEARSSDETKTVSNSRESPLESVSVHQDKIVRANDDCCVLTPDKGNYHELIPVEGSAVFLDILAPPYNRSKGRDCQYYEFAKCVGREEDESIQWLRGVPVPSYYRCNRLQYTGPQI